MDICDFAYRVIITGKIQFNFLTDMGSTRKLWLLGGKNLSDVRFGYLSSIMKIHSSRPALSSRAFYSDGNMPYLCPPQQALATGTDYILEMGIV